MLKKAKSWKLFEMPEGVLRCVYKAPGDKWERNVVIKDCTLDGVKEYQAKRPAPIYITLAHSLWLYKDECFVADRKLTADEVVALLLEKEIKHQRRIARATATVAQAGSGTRVRTAIPADVKIFVWQRDGGKCVECGVNENLAYDHIVPLSRGGSNTARNLQLLCDDCNRDKSDSI